MLKKKTIITCYLKLFKKFPKHDISLKGIHGKKNDKHCTKVIFV